MQLKLTDDRRREIRDTLAAWVERQWAPACEVFASPEEMGKAFSEYFEHCYDVTKSRTVYCVVRKDDKVSRFTTLKEILGRGEVEDLQLVAICGCGESGKIIAQQICQLFAAAADLLAENDELKGIRR